MNADDFLDAPSADDFLGDEPAKPRAGAQKQPMGRGFSSRPKPWQSALETQPAEPAQPIQPSPLAITAPRTGDPTLDAVNILFDANRTPVQRVVSRNRTAATLERQKQGQIQQAREDTDAAFGGPVGQAVAAPGRRLLSGIYSTLAGITGIPQLVGSDLGTETSRALSTAAAANMPEEPSLADNVLSGVGQIGPMISGGGALRAGLAPLFGERAALELATGGMGAVGGAMSGQQVLDDLENRPDLGADDKQQRALAAAVISAITGKYADKFLLPGADKLASGPLAAGARAFIAEGGQEGLDQITQNAVTDKPLGEGLGQAALVGGIVGGGSRVAGEVNSPAFQLATALDRDTRDLSNAPTPQSVWAPTNPVTATQLAPPAPAPVVAPAPAPVPQLGYDPDVKPAVMVAEQDGTVRPQTADEFLAADEARTQATDTGLTPDVRRAQEARARTEGETNAPNPDLAGRAEDAGKPAAVNPNGSPARMVEPAAAPDRPLNAALPETTIQAAAPDAGPAPASGAVQPEQQADGAVRADDVQQAREPAPAVAATPTAPTATPDAASVPPFAKTETAAARAPANEPTNSLARTASWVIRNKETGDVVMETFDRAKVDALNTAKYEAVPIQEHLAGLNRAGAAPASSLPNVASQRVPAETAPQLSDGNPPPLDHGELNIPGRTKNIDAELDRYKADKAKTERADAKQQAATRRDAKAQARTVFDQVWPAMREKMGAKFGEKQLRDTLDQMVKWEPQKFLKMAEKFQREQQEAPAADQRSEQDVEQFRASQPGTSNTSTAASIRTELSARFGPIIDRLEKRGILKVWDSVDDYNAAPGQQSQLPDDARGVQGMYGNGVAHLFGDGIEPGNAVGVLLHEVGEHASMKKMLGEERYRDLVRRAYQLADQGDDVAETAMMRIPEDTPDKFYDSEMLAYMIEEAANRGQKASPSVRKWLAEVVAAIRAWLYQTPFGKRLEQYGAGLDLTAQDIVALAERAVRWQAQQEGGTQTGAAPQLARAFHGTPHNFDSFSTEHIGSGEGAQAFGYGLYFAENDKVAKEYQFIGAQIDPDAVKYKGKKLESLYNAAQAAQERGHRMAASPAKDAAIAKANAELGLWESMMTRNHPKQVIETALDPENGWPEQEEFARSLDLSKFTGVDMSPGKLYQVDIPDPVVDKMLLWDKPMSEQPEVFNKIDDAIRAGSRAEQWRVIETWERDGQDWTGEQVYRYIAGQVEYGDRGASDLLDEHGVPGIKYRDAGSRDQREGTHNLVVFNDKNVTITHKDGSPVKAAEREEAMQFSRPPVSRTGSTPQSVATVAQPWNVPEPGTWDNFVRAIQDNKIDLKRVRSAIEEQFGRVPEQADAYLGEELYHGKVAARVERLHTERVEPILRKIVIAGKNNGVTLDDVNAYLHAMHAPERNAAMAAINPGVANNTALSGMSDADAAAALAGFRTSGKLADLQAIGKDVFSLLEDTRTALVADGLEEAGVVQAWEQAYKHYVPLQRDVEGGPAKGSGFNVKGPEAKRATGSNKQAVNILANVVTQAETAAIRAEKAEVGRTLLAMAQAYPNPDFWTVDTPPTKPRINPATGLVERSAVDPNFQAADNVLMVKDYGAARFIIFDKGNERAMQVARGMKNLDAAPLPKVVQLAGKGTRFIASLLTQRNPEFWLTNFSRDIQGAMVQLGGTDATRLQKEVLTNLPKALAGVRDLVRGSGTGQWARHAQELKDAGGTTGYMQTFADSDARMKDLQKEVDKMGQGAADPRRLFRQMLDFVDDYNDVIENGMRLAVFQAARDAGVSSARAASVAKNITVNFNRKGAATPFVNSLYMFFNAGVQGNARLAQALTTSRTAQVAVGSMVGLAFMMDIVNRAMAGDDDDTKKNRYDLINEFEKSRNWIFMDRSGNYVKIPLPLGFHVFHNVGRLMGDALTRKDARNAAEYGWAMGSTLLDAFSPLGGFASVGQLISPSITDPVVQVAENKNFMGGPVYRSADRGFGNVDPKPAYTRFFENTPQVWKSASKFLNDATGGDKDKPGRINIEPDILRHVWGTFTGGPGRALDKGIDTAQASAKGEELTPQRIPVVNRFAGSNDDRQRESAYYGDLKRAALAKSQYDNYLKVGRRDLALEVVTDLGRGDPVKGRQLISEFTSSKKDVATINKRIRQLEQREDQDAVATQVQALKERRKDRRFRALENTADQ